jgi:hypothetical protein
VRQIHPENGNEIMRVLSIIMIFMIALVGITITEYPSWDGSYQLSDVSPEDAYVLLDNLLELSEKKGNIKAKLVEYRKWEKAYVKYSSVERPTELDIKIFLMIIFIAHERYMAHNLEQSADDIVAIFKRNSKLFLAVLKKKAFLIPSACDCLRDHIDLYARPGKTEFIDSNKGLILESLGEKLGQQCMEKLQFQFKSNQVNAGDR